MSDREWLVPSIVLTALSAGFALLMIPDYSGVLPALQMLPYWMLVAVSLGCLNVVLAMMAAQVEGPLAHLRQRLVKEWRTLAVWTFCIALAGLNMITFMWVKPLLNYLVPFWADPLLANIDSAIFLGHDPWTFLSWLNSKPTAIFYHRGWFALMVFTLLFVLSRPPSPKKSAVLLTYFVLWSIVGPVVHCILPAAGPIFYEQLGYGDRFVTLQSTPITAELATYLWTLYENGGFGPGSGISAMPSLHIAMIVWMIIAFYVFARRWTVPVTIVGFVIFLLSISLGWHYAVDGVVGGMLAALCYWGLHTMLKKREQLTPCAAAA